MTNRHVNYPTAAIRAKVSVSTLMKAVAAGKIRRHTDPRDRRRTLLDPEEVAAYFNPNDTTTFEVTPLEVAQALTITAIKGNHELYRAVREAIPTEALDTVALIAGPNGLQTLDQAAGYTPEQRDNGR